MFIIRPLKEEDFPKLWECALLSHGMYSLPKDKKLLETELQTSISALNKPTGEMYFFGLEDTETGSLGGVSAIHRVMGYPTPFPFFRVEKDLLIPTLLENGPSELCALYLLPPYRKGGHGRLLSLSRLHFIATFPSRFKPTLAAWMRGYTDERHQSPFWRAIGQHLFHLSLEEAQICPSALDIRHQTPIPIASLPLDAQEVIGKTHPNTAPAFKMLQEEGFAWNQLIDILDGGPVVEAPTASLKTVRDSQLLTLTATQPLNDTTPCALISNPRLNFRATLAPFQPPGILTEATASALQLSLGDPFRVSSLH